MNHTPGPWAADDQHNPLIYSDAARAYVAQVLAYTDGTTGTLRAGVDADARLICAAPAMLAALRLLVRGDGQPDECARAMRAAREALALAEGQQ